MKAFSPAGPAVKAFFGYGAKTFGNPTGQTSGDGATDGLSTNDGINPNILPPPATPVAAPTTLNVFITSDHIAAANSAADGVHFSTLLTAPELAAWNAGTYDTLNISGSGAPARGYWVISGASDFAGGGAGAGFVFDMMSPNPVVINFNMAILRIYGSGAPGGIGSGFNNGGAGGNAMVINNTNIATLNLNVLTGRLYAGGGGGGGSLASGMGGGGGAGGWERGNAGFAATVGGVYDTANGGTGNPAVPGGSGGITNVPHGGNGAQMGQAGQPGTGSTGGAAGSSITTNGSVTVNVVSGAGNIIGAHP